MLFVGCKKELSSFLFRFTLVTTDALFVPNSLFLYFALLFQLWPRLIFQAKLTQAQALTCVYVVVQISDLLYYNFFIDFFFLPCLPLRASIFRAVSLHINQYPNKVHSYALPIFARLLVMLVISFSLHSIFEKHVFEGINSIIIWLC